MKRYLRCLALLLCLCVLSGSLSSCMMYFRLSDMISEMTEDVLYGTETGDKDHTSGEMPDDLPLEYTLTDADRDAFYAQLQLCRELTLTGTDQPAIDEAWELLEDLYYHIATQSQIAYILYCWDQTNEAISDAYLYSSEMSSEAYADYMALCQEIDESESPYREEFFSDWTEDEIEEMRAYSDEFSALYEENDRILVEYRELDEKDFDRKAAEYYLETVQNNNRIAGLLGYDNYYDYAYEKIYLRDYSTEQVEQMRRYVKSYLISLCRNALSSFQTAYERLNRVESDLVYNLLYSDYDALSFDYVAAYIDASRDSAKRAMLKMFEPGNAIFTDSEKSYEGAFTATLYEYEQAVCYFGPGYQSVNTIVHELGHYYASQYVADEDLAIDLAEVHSQGNEMLFLVFLKDHISAKAYEALVQYQIYNVLASIILCVAIDEFEQTVYQNASSIVKPSEDMDRMMSEIVADYGGADFFMQNIADPYWYWRRVTIESPIYYISYAVSGLASIELYASAVQNYGAAEETYRKLTEEITDEDGFLGALEKAGLGSPFDSSTYIHIVNTLNQR